MGHNSLLLQVLSVSLAAKRSPREVPMAFQPGTEVQGRINRKFHAIGTWDRLACCSGGQIGRP